MGTGNDTLLVSGGSVSDTIALGDGDDKATIGGKIGVSTLDGGAGADTLTFDGAAAGAPKYMSFGLQKADASWLYFGNHYVAYSATPNGTNPTIDALQAALAGGPLQFQYGFSTTNTSIESLTWKGVETVNAKGGVHEDTLVYINGTEYAGNGGVDTFYADWSSWTEAVIWTNTKNAGNSQLSDEAVSTLGATHQVKVSGMERLLLLTGSGNDTIVQNVTGSDDEFRTGAGNDFIDGGSGNDQMLGGKGNDTYVVNSTGDVVTELASEGADTVSTWINYTLGTNLENLRILATGSINGTGNELANVMFAGDGNNVLDGAGGTDTVSFLYAASGVTANLAAAGQQATGGSGSDTLLNFENLTGSGFNDVLAGNAGANVLDGGAGADAMAGGDGSDTYYVDNAGDVVTEVNADAATGGTDLVLSQLANYTLGANVENGRILAAGAANLSGNSIANTLFAGAGNNSIAGGAGSTRCLTSTASAAARWA
ncbi:MAG: hypothetical protein IPG91_01500 [Ideonella sp.]|nr:hypothetical protein [Ideonella sp.]